MSKYTGTKTEKNLMEAFSGESQARNKLLLGKCDQKRLVLFKWQIFLKKLLIKEIPKMWFKELYGIGSVRQDLKDAAVRE